MRSSSVRLDELRCPDPEEIVLRDSDILSVVEWVDEEKDKTIELNLQAPTSVAVKLAHYLELERKKVFGGLKEEEQRVVMGRLDKSNNPK